ncbi:hypothetical protein SODALDRAFT_340880 [Sodiomyces alkalinus F11]|uniref:Clock-controlled protein 6 n=1 Tax=Sodiomyces alkalinus (strain CBS 110278 / VKM F-3762 / F11) TaxID=1314773 RepID=A0A3N2PTR2_SODAK|nr:hypothetical protein SODALDRAFT_340880 [Sodiomyces alkalinus F11]ROT37716.1 hypothetical protein SODALDRAFT_340880 [Sodiomyces alkalinus F11]
MKFSVAVVLSAAAGAMAGFARNNVTYVTEVVSEYVTYCPEPTTITHGDHTYTVTEATTLTITDCPCTITKPVIISSVVSCHDCPSSVPIPPPVISIPSNQTATWETVVPTLPVEPTPSDDQPITVPTAGAGKLAALSGAGLAGVFGIAAFIL